MERARTTPDGLRHIGVRVTQSTFSRAEATFDAIRKQKPHQVYEFADHIRYLIELGLNHINQLNRK